MATKLWGGVLGQHMFPVWVATVLVAAAAVQAFFLQARPAMRPIARAPPPPPTQLPDERNLRFGPMLFAQNKRVGEVSESVVKAINKRLE